MKLFLNFITLFIAGALLPLAFAPTGFYLLAVISPIFLLHYLTKKSSYPAFWGSFIYGVGFFGFGAYWIYISINTYGNTNFIISSIITGGFIAVLALFFAVMGYFYKKYFGGYMSFAALWVLFEWIRSWFLTGFPWLLLGQSQTNSPLHGYAPVIGLYGMTFLVVFSSGLIYDFITHFKKPIKLLNLILVLLIWLGGDKLSFIQWSKPSSDSFNITLIQGNIAQSTKWDPDQAFKTLQRYEELTQLHLDSQLILWPETAVTFLYPDAQVFLKNLNHTLQKNDTAVITGIPIPQDNKYYNGAIILGLGNHNPNQYLKRHLVPFGEYVPFQNLLRGIIGFFNLPMSSFSSGPYYQKPLIIKNMIISPFICYEIAYSDLLRANLPQANLLITLSNDAWFNQSEALAQHRQIAQLAAQMTQRYMLVATNSGETVVINPEGEIIDKAPNNKTVAITTLVQTYSGTTPWIRWGNWPLLILMVVILSIRFWINNRLSKS